MVICVDMILITILISDFTFYVFKVNFNLLAPALQPRGHIYLLRLTLYDGERGLLVNLKYFNGGALSLGSRDPALYERHSFVNNRLKVLRQFVKRTPEFVEAELKLRLVLKLTKTFSRQLSFRY